MSARRWLALPGFLAAHPYYAAVLARLDVLSNPAIRNLALARGERRLYLMVNDAATHDPEAEKALLMHAVHHVVMGHLSHPRFAHPAHPELMTLAMEITASEFIPYPLPCGPRWQDFGDLGMAPRQSTLRRYEILVRARRAGRDLAVTSTCDTSPAGGLRSHEQDEAALEHARAVAEEAVASVAIPPAGAAGELAGKSPGHALQMLAAVARTPETPLDWHAMLARFTSRARAPVHTWSRPARRFPDRLGEVPGRAYSPQRGIRPRIACALDTSASVSPKELEEIALHLADIAAFADLTIIECDARVQRVRRFDGALRTVRGRGGTDLRPPFERALVDRFGPDGVIYFTDGLGPTPERAPRVPVLWVLTKDAPFRCPWGERVKLRP